MFLEIVAQALIGVFIFCMFSAIKNAIAASGHGLEHSRTKLLMNGHLFYNLDNFTEEGKAFVRRSGRYAGGALLSVFLAFTLLAISGSL